MPFLDVTIPRVLRIHSIVDRLNFESESKIFDFIIYSLFTQKTNICNFAAIFFEVIKRIYPL